MKEFTAYSNFDIIRAYESENGEALTENIKAARIALTAAETALDENDTAENFKAWENACKVFDAAFDAREKAVGEWFNENADRFEFVH